jgi:hypothetical protein
VKFVEELCCAELVINNMLGWSDVTNSLRGSGKVMGRLRGADTQLIKCLGMVNKIINYEQIYIIQIQGKDEFFRILFFCLAADSPLPVCFEYFLY